MAVTGNSGVVTVLDWAKRLDSGGKTAIVAEVLHESNNILTDALVVKGNAETGNRVTRRATLPSTTRRRVNQGVAPNSSATDQVTDAISLISIWTKVDRTMLDLVDSEARFVATEHHADLEAISQDFSDQFFYGDAGIVPEEFTGLSPRYNALGDDKWQVLDAGGTSNLSSIWVVTYGPNKTHLFFPKNYMPDGKQMAGQGMGGALKWQDYPNLPVTDDNGAPLPGWQRYYEFAIGLSVRDPRYNVRIANIDTSELLDAGGSGFDGPDLEFLLIDAMNALPAFFDPATASSGRQNRTVIYLNKDVYRAIERLSTTKPNSLVSVQPFGGTSILTFRGYPLRRADALVNTETRVV